MKIQLRYFAGVREALGISDETVAPSDGIATVGDVRGWLRARDGVWAETLAEGRALQMACNHVTAGLSTRITDGCEVASFSPVTGGESGQGRGQAMPVRVQTADFDLTS